MSRIIFQSDTADIALLLEGTYPYVRGGVSAWVHEIITGLPQYRFALIFLGSEPGAYEQRNYELPENVVHFEEHFLTDFSAIETGKSGTIRATDFANIELFHEQLKTRQLIDRENINASLSCLEAQLGISLDDFLFSQQSWDYLTQQYEALCSEDSFIDYFWTIRVMHAPLFKLAKIAQNIPKVSVLHAISTGYAGFLGSLILQRRDLPFILTEHGIYTKERKIDLARAEWIKETEDGLERPVSKEMGHIRQLWIRFFEGLGRLTYQSANPIFSLYGENQARQIRDGANPEHTAIIPNGISIQQYEKALNNRGKDIPPVIALIGRVVPIKDVKNFIRAIRLVCEENSEIEGWIIGPQDEDKTYYEECLDLISQLNLEDKIQFLGFQNMVETYHKVGLVALTSISEALPLVILEAFAAGVPCLATDVGACRELIEGREGEDAELGHAGAIVPIADPKATATAMLTLIGDEESWYRAQQAGLARVKQFYTKEMMLDRYANVYDGVL